MLSNVLLNIANKKFNFFANDYELQLNDKSIVIEDDKEDEKIPKNVFNFKLISEINSLKKDTILGEEI